MGIYRKYAVDIQVKQRIISKLRGTKRIIGRLLGEYDFEKKQVVNSPIIEFLKKNSDISDFDESINSIKLKTKELELYGYTY